MIIRTATYDDLDEAQRIYGIARKAMRAAGNTVQWVNGYPSRELLSEDVEHGQLYIVEQDERPCAVFAFCLGDDPTYAQIDGAWIDDGPYGTIHRIGSDGTAHGVLAAAVGFARERCRSIRVDTHESNSPMRNALVKQGFSECGTIVIDDGTPRVAYQIVC